MTKTIHFPLEGWRENPKPFGKEINMAVTLTPQKKVFTERGGAGRKATEPMVTISENGQLGFNSLVIPALQGMTHAILYDSRLEGDKRKETTIKLAAFKTEKWPVKLKGGFTFEEKQVAKLNWSQIKDDVAKACNVTMSGDLKELGYDFKASQGQKFKALVEGNSVTFTVPVGSLPPKPKQARTKKADKPANGANGAVASATKQAQEELLEM